MAYSTKLFEDSKYSNNRIIHEVTEFPGHMPLPCKYEHGHTPDDFASPRDLKTRKQLMLVYNKRRLNIWQNASNIHAEIFGSPFVRYRHHKNIKQNADAKGTLCFPAHSGFKEQTEYSREDYCKELQQLDPKFHPITICLHEHDYDLGYAKVYEEYGFNIVCAGKRTEPDFVDKFYDILVDHKYATSNFFGSYIFYAVELGLHFFYFGDKPRLKDASNASQDMLQPEESEFGALVYEAFDTYPNVETTDQQRQIVADEVGLKDAIDNNALVKILRNYYPSQKRIDCWNFIKRHPLKLFKLLFTK